MKNPSHLSAIGALVLAVLAAACGGKPREDLSAAKGGLAATARSQRYEDLVSLFEEWRVFVKPQTRDFVPDYTPAAIREKRRGLEAMRRRLTAIDPAGWPIEHQADYLLVLAEMNGLDFNLRIVRPWSRDPGYYAVFGQFQPTIEGTLEVPELPVPADKAGEFRLRLQAVPRILDQARANLTEPAADLARLAVDFKKRESERLAELAADLDSVQPELAPDARRAREAVDAYRAWLEANLGRWDPRAGIGVENYNWYVKNVWLLPYTWQELLTISERELERAVSLLELEEHRNRRLPPLVPVRSETEFRTLFDEDQAFLLDFLKREEIFTVPEFMGLRPAGGWNRDRGPDLFENVLDRDPLPLQPHDFVGHNPDAERESRDTRPIRGRGRLYHIAGVRAEALATGMEEILMHTGLLDREPRSRELTYMLLAFRAARAVADLKMHSNDMTFGEAFDYVVRAVPYGWVSPKSTVLWGDLDLYLRQPCYGVGYLIGSVQLQQLIADRARQAGGEFNLRDFFDRFLASGMVPISLIRWEMTGFDDQVREFRR